MKSEVGPINEIRTQLSDLKIALSTHTALCGSTSSSMQLSSNVVSMDSPATLQTSATGQFQPMTINDFTAVKTVSTSQVLKNGIQSGVLENSLKRTKSVLLSLVFEQAE